MGAKFRLGIMYTDTEKYMGMESTRSGMKVIPVSCKRPLTQAGSQHNVY